MKIKKEECLLTNPHITQRSLRTCTYSTKFFLAVVIWAMGQKISSGFPETKLGNVENFNGS